MNAEGRSEMRRYCVGAIVSAGLTAVAFWVVLAAPVSRPATFWIIGLAAVAQLVTQLRCFLHISWNQKREDMQLIGFSLVLLGLMVGGSIWIMTNLAQRMH